MIGFRHRALAVAALAAVALGASSASAGYVYRYTVHSNGAVATTAPAPAAPPKLAFVSPAIGSAALGALSNFDAICQNAATAAGRTGTYKAWISNSATDALTRLGLPADAPITSPSGKLIANNVADLTDGTLANGINENANGSVTTLGSVYTGTRATGLRASSDSNLHCANWTTAASSWTYRAILGTPGTTDASWTSRPNSSVDGTEWGHCDWGGWIGVYCFQTQ